MRASWTGTPTWSRRAAESRGGASPYIVRKQLVKRPETLLSAPSESKSLSGPGPLPGPRGGQSHRVGRAKRRQATLRQSNDRSSMVSSWYPAGMTTLEFRCFVRVPSPSRNPRTRGTCDRLVRLAAVRIAKRDFRMTTIYVGNLPFNATEQDVKTLFERHGTVESVKLINDRETGRPRGFGFVEMSQSEAQGAIQALNGFQMNGRALRVNEAQERAPRPRQGGGPFRR